MSTYLWGMLNWQFAPRTQHRAADNLVTPISLAVWGWVMSELRWRVVAIRRNGKPIVLDEYLSLERAEAFRKSLLSINVFPEVRIEPDVESRIAPSRDVEPIKTSHGEENGQV